MTYIIIQAKHIPIFNLHHVLLVFETQIADKIHELKDSQYQRYNSLIISDLLIYITITTTTTTTTTTITTATTSTTTTTTTIKLNSVYLIKPSY